MVEEEDGVSGHQSLRRRGHRVHGIVGRLGVEGIGGWVARERGIARRPNGGEVLIAGDGGLLGMQ